MSKLVMRMARQRDPVLYTTNKSSTSGVGVAGMEKQILGAPKEEFLPKKPEMPQTGKYIPIIMREQRKRQSAAGAEYTTGNEAGTLGGSGGASRDLLG